jgi:hypothetical protein
VFADQAIQRSTRSRSRYSFACSCALRRCGIPLPPVVPPHLAALFGL